MSWGALLTEQQRDELVTLRNFRHRTIQEIGRASIEVAHAEEILASAKQNLQVGIVSVRELEDRIAKRLRLFLGEHADRLGAVDIDDL